MARNQARRMGRRLWLALLLAWVGGSVDGIGFLTLFGLFTSHQSGNTVVMGVSTAMHDWAEAIRRAFPVLIFVIGLVVGSLLTHADMKHGRRALLAPVLGTEAVLLLLFLVLGSLALQDGVLDPNRPALFYPLAALPALAMGMQNTTLKKVGGIGVRTTFVSGILSTMADQLADYLVWLRVGLRRGHRLGVLLRVSARQPAFNAAMVAGSVWLAFLLGAIIGGLAQQQWQLFSLAGPIALLTAISVVDLIQPLSQPPTA
jgi:uncharacterized membrane protein YoaK (UPF0700 family)